MYAVRRLHLEVEMIKWVALIGVALALATLFAVRTAGADELKPVPEPALMPQDMIDTAQALQQPPATPYFPEGRPPVVQTDPQLALQLWNVIELHRTGTPEQAAAAWQKLPLLGEGELWRQLGLGVTSLQIGDLDQAQLRLDAARQLSPRHPVVAYFMGILHLEQAAQAEFLDQKFEVIRLVAYVPDEVVPATNGMFKLAAIMELKAAIDRAGELNLAEPLVRVTGAVGPTVNDLLTVWGAENYVGNAHNTLAYLSLDEGWLQVAEDHLDAAAATGMTIPYGYQDLGRFYEARQQSQNALRAYGKALEQYAQQWKPLAQWLETASEPWFVW